MRLSARVRANRRNALKSCGPRTAEGKRRASQNARKHGLAAAVERDPADAAAVELRAASLRAGLPNAPEEAIREIASAEISLNRIDRYVMSVRAKPLTGAEAASQAIRAYVIASRYEGEARGRLRRARKVLFAVKHPNR